MTVDRLKPVPVRKGRARLVKSRRVNEIVSGAQSDGAWPRLRLFATRSRGSQYGYGGCKWTK